MRRLFYLFVVSLLTVSCTLEVSDNGDLDGYWQLTRVDSLVTGNSADMRETGIFWAVSYEMLVTRSTKQPMGEVIFEFQHTADSLFLTNPYVLYRDSSDIKVTDVNYLRRFGVNSLDEKFHVLQLSSSKMVLESELLRLYLRKY